MSAEQPAPPISALAAAGSPVKLAVYPNPFARNPVVDRVEMPAGLTIEAMLLHTAAAGHIDPAALSLLRVSIGPHMIPREKWRVVRPRAGIDLLVSVQPGNGGSVRTILQIGVAIGASVVGFAIGGPLGGLAAAAITIGGNLLVNALVPIRQPEQQARKDRYSLDGAGNQARPHMPVPIVMGRRRIYPPRAANYYTVMSGQDVYLRCLFQPSVGWVDRDAVKIGETLVSAYDGVTINWHTRPDDSASLSWFAATPAEDAIAIQLKSANGWQTRAAPLACDRISLDLAFLSGLYRVDGSGNTKSTSCAIDVRYGPRGGAPEDATPAPIGSSGRVTFSRADVSAYRQTFEWAVDLGEYDVHVRRFTADSSDAKISDKATWVNLRAFHPDPALPQADTTPWVEVEVKASDQLNGALDTFNFVATTMAKQATETGPGATWAPTRNPADLFLAATYAPYSDLDLDDDERIFADIADWRALCAAQGWNCDIAEDGETSVGDLLQRIAATGRARPTVDFGALTVMVDWEKPVPRQLFAARTVQTFKGELVYPETVDALRLRFANADKDYGDDTVVVYAPGQDATTATRYDSIEIRDKTAVAEVEREGQRIMAERLLRPESFTFSQDIEQIAVREGERAWLQHPAGLIGQISGRVMALLSRPASGGGTQYGVRIDELVTMIDGPGYGLAWRPGVATLVSAQVETVADDTDELWFTVTPSSFPAVGDLVAFGERLLEVLDVVVDRVTPKPGMRAEIACVAYAPELQGLASIALTTTRSPPSIPPGALAQLVQRRNDTARDEALTAALQQGALNTRNIFRGVHSSSLAYAVGEEVSNSANDRLYGAIIDVPTGISLTNTTYWALKLVSGGGAAGDNAVNVRLTNPLIMVATAADGSGGNYAGLTSQIEVYDGTVRKDTTGVCTFSVVGSPSWASVTATGGAITITDWGSTTAFPAFDVVYAGVTYRVVMQLIRSLQGVAGPAITMVGGGAITYVDGVLTPGGQSRTLSITRQNATGTATWTTVPGGITLTGSGDSRTLTAANMGSNKQVTIRATVGAVYDEDTVIRADDSTAEAGATRNEDGGNLIDKSFTLVDFSSLSGLIRREAPVYAGTSAPYVVVHDATATGLGYLNAPPGFPVKPGETIWISARYFQNSLPGGSTMRLKAEFSNAAGAYISGSDIFVGLRTVGSNFPNVSITDVVDSFVVPANAASCRLSTSPNNSFGSGGYSAVERPWAGRAEPGATVGATAAQITLINTAIADAANAQATADGKIDTFYQATAPAGSEGDLWFDTDDGYRQYRKTGGSWIAVADNRIGQAISDAAGAQATADGKVTTFTGEGTPTAEGLGDLWYKPSIKTLYRWNGASWLVASPTGVSDGATRNEDGGNLIEKPFTLADFSAVSGLIRREAPAYAGSSAPYVVVHDSTATGQGYLSLSPGFPVKPGEQIWVAARYYQNSLPASSTMRLKAEFSDAAGAYISGVDAFVGLRTVGSNFPNTTIIDVVDSFTVPAGAASCRLSTNPNNSFGSVGYSAVERPWAGRQAPGATRNVDRGTWSSSSIAYVIGDEVQKDGSTWGAIADHVSSGGNGPPSLPTTSNSTWRLRSKIGDTGATGADGADGTDGADGLSIAASVPVIHVAMTPAGLPKSGELPKSTQMVIYYGFTDVTAGCTFSRTTNNCSVTNAGGGAFTVTALTAQPAWFDVTATYGSQSITMRIPINQPLDGSPASRASASVTSMNSTGTYTAIGQVDLVVAAGATINAAGSVNYNAAFFSGTGTRTVRAQARMTIENVSDGGSPVAGGAVIGSAASYIGGDGPSDVGSVSASYSITNSSGGAKLFRAKLEIRYYDGAANIDTTSGSYAGTVEISAA